MKKKKYVYIEKKKALANRITSHKKFSNFDLHSWVKKNIKIKNGDRILDIGCGDGNFIKLFHQMNCGGEIIGVDKNDILINSARKKFKLKRNIKFIKGDFDNIKFSKKKFDCIFFIYSIYYTENSSKLILKVLNYLNEKGKLIIVGPGANNAKQIDKLNFLVTKKRPNKEYRFRQQRIEKEFYPLLKKHFSSKKVNLKLINNHMAFKTDAQLADYYWSTLLWRQSLQQLRNYDLKRLKELTIKKIKYYIKNLKLKKQISILTLKK